MGEETYWATSSLALTLFSGWGSFIVLEYTLVPENSPGASLRLKYKVCHQLLRAHQMTLVSSVVITSNICGLTSPPSTAEGEPSGSLSLSPPPNRLRPLLVLQANGKSETSIIPVNKFGHVEHSIIH